MSGVLCGIDVGGTSAKIALFDEAGNMLRKWELPTGKAAAGKETLSAIADSVRKALEAMEQDISLLDGVGLTVPGPVLPDGSVREFANLSWGNIPFREILSEELQGTPVEVINDANAAALGELWKGAGEGLFSLVMVTLGTGVGGGIVVNGKIVSGAHGAGGEIGHMHVSDEETEACGCGKRGCLEQYAAAPGMIRMAKQYLSEKDGARSVLHDTKQLTAKSIMDAAKAKDAVALRVVDTMCRTLGVSLARIACVADPDIIVIGGGVSKAGQIIPDTIRPYYEDAAFFACRHTPIVLAKLGNDAGCFGAARMVLP